MLILFTWDIMFRRFTSDLSCFLEKNLVVSVIFPFFLFKTFLFLTRKIFSFYPFFTLDFPMGYSANFFQQDWFFRSKAKIKMIVFVSDYVLRIHPMFGTKDGWDNLMYLFDLGWCFPWMILYGKSVFFGGLPDTTAWNPGIFWGNFHVAFSRQCIVRLENSGNPILLIDLAIPSKHTYFWPWILQTKSDFIYELNDNFWFNSFEKSHFNMIWKSCDRNSGSYFSRKHISRVPNFW